MEDHLWEALERALNETEVLKAIYGGEEEDENNPPNTTSFAIVSPSKKDLQSIQRTLGLENGEYDDVDDESSMERNDKASSDDFGEGRPPLPPALQIEICTQIQGELETSNSIEEDDGMGLVLRCDLPQGYPASACAVVTSIQTHPPLPRSGMDEITRALHQQARELLGTEVVLDLIETAKELCRTKHQEQQQIKQQQSSQNQPLESSVPPPLWGRRWIWVHHITKKDRIQSIVDHAQEWQLVGILKHGYPGVVLVEGSVPHCQEFCKWIKADKSSPLGGGFGRNWGHHVRGELNGIPASTGLASKDHSLHTTEELSVMAHHCRCAGLEDEFREFVLQHKGG